MQKVQTQRHANAKTANWCKRCKNPESCRPQISVRFLGGERLPCKAALHGSGGKSDRLRDTTHDKPAQFSTRMRFWPVGALKEAGRTRRRRGGCSGSWLEVLRAAGAAGPVCALLACCDFGCHNAYDMTSSFVRAGKMQVSASAVGHSRGSGS